MNEQKIQNKKMEELLEYVAIQRNSAKEMYEIMKDNFYLGKFEEMEKLFWHIKKILSPQ